MVWQELVSGEYPLLAYMAHMEPNLSTTACPAQATLHTGRMSDFACFPALPCPTWRLRFLLIAGAAILLTGCGTEPKLSALPSNTQFPFLSRRIFIEDFNDIIINFTALRSQFKLYAKNVSDPIGVYFEYLPSGSSISINAETPFIAASLLKVPMAIEIYRLAADGELDMEERVRILPQDIDADFGSLWQKGAGTELSIREMVRAMVRDSDNTALRVLMRVVGVVHPGYLNDVFDELDIPKSLSEDTVIISAKNYTSVLKNLFLATSLSRKDAHEILTMMTQSSLNNGLPAGVPPAVPVAHKIGVYEKSGRITYSDCGIVYVPQRPYALCIFAHSTEEKAYRYMQDFSRMAYRFVSAADARSSD